ncbi:hypothetical protein OY671_012078, partial [Metschnikowia pulcherrima]
GSGPVRNSIGEGAGGGYAGPPRRCPRHCSHRGRPGRRRAGAQQAHLGQATRQGAEGIPGDGDRSTRGIKRGKTMGTNNMRGAGRSAIAIAGSTAGTQAMAQEASQNQGFGDIVVTAQRRQENLQTVPIQVAAFSEEKIADAGIQSTREFVNSAPN